MEKYKIKTKTETIRCASYDDMIARFFNLRKSGIPCLAIIN